ncbi:Hypothetical protein PP7435_CHR3-0649 [Komagataella phaffii CBS 7435]|uniref:Uncharacterized protein n=1 Tax=Komagataella phaffii (strain ATCC 76273 / CBS 7435 / CECT 11047 / NRRL Y-11430 / Wegner 21-1) TaxID=981350 RepID=F2QW28_KOMPC|nr:Hypothetical protein BQ9382_C3-3452 [Komagataella phaffii CBS 7435]CCA39606.1 Hypothetical protein PP7435_CHR3-0649 [Komagataella phaffii CBS 7435]
MYSGFQTRKVSKKKWSDSMALHNYIYLKHHHVDGSDAKELDDDDITLIMVNERRAIQPSQDQEKVDKKRKLRPRKHKKNALED